MLVKQQRTAVFREALEMQMCTYCVAPEKGPSLHLPAPQFLSLVVLSSGQSTSRQHWGGFCPVS